MKKRELNELICLVEQIKELVNGERFGANYKEYNPNINRFESLVFRFYEIASEQTLPIDTLREILDGKESLNELLLHLQSKMCTNKFDNMRLIFLEIEQIMSSIIMYEHQ